MKTNRRTLLKALGVSTFIPIIAYVAVKDNTEDKEKFLRPPGGEDEKDFTSKCIKCGRCIAVCPENTIFPLKVTGSIGRAGTPVMDFKYSACNLCISDIHMQCIKVCPTEALKNIERKDVKIGIAKIIKETCIAWQSNGCIICKDACPEKAIELTESGLEPVIWEDKCNGCGICEKVCPTALAGAYKGEGRKGVIILPNSERV